MKLQGKVLSAKEEKRTLTSKQDGTLKEHKIYHVLLLAQSGKDAEVLNCESWNPENFTLPEIGKDWETPPIRSVQFEGSVGTVRF